MADVRQYANKGGKSTIGRMMIRGIRSFDPNHEETIEFYSPLTMIIGANGCGKTTIIECLKYSTTGALPPSSRAGHSFINDPGMTDSSEVKAQVKLRFNNAAGEVNVVSRSLQLTKKKVKMEFKALEGMLRIKNNQGGTSSISYKCADLDKQVPLLLGVSPAILENVIFTHQEDASWPMGDGATLKKKFDDIFESTRYTKALDAFQKSKKEFSAKAKDLKAEVMELGAHLQAAKQSQQERDDSKDKADEFRETMEQLAEKIEQSVTRLNGFKQEQTALNARYSELADLERSICDISSRMEDKERNLAQVYKESDSQLQDMLSNFETVMVEKGKQMHAITRQVDKLASDIEGLRSQSDKLMQNKGIAENLKSTVRNQEKKYREQACHISRRHEIRSNVPESGPAADKWKWVSDDAAQFANRLDSHIQSAQRASDDLVQGKKDIYNAATKRLSQLQHTVDRYEMEIETKDKQRDQLHRDMDLVGGNIMQLNMSKAKLQSKRKDYETAQKELDEFLNSADMPQSQFGSSSANSQLDRPGYDAMGCWLGYEAARSDLNKRINQARELLSRVQSEYSEDESFLNSLSSQRNELIAKEAAVALAQDDVKKEKNNLVTFWTKSRATLHAAGIDGDVPLELTQLDRKITDINAPFEQCCNKLLNEQKNYKRAAAEVSADNALIAELEKRLDTLRANGRGADKLDEANQAFNSLQRGYITDVVDPDIQGVAANVLRFRNHKDWGSAMPFSHRLDLIKTPELMQKHIEKMMEKVSNNKAKKSVSEHFKEKFEESLLDSIVGTGEPACPCCQQLMNAQVRETFNQKLELLFADDDEEETDPNKVKAVKSSLKNIHDQLKELDTAFTTANRQLKEEADIQANLAQKEASVRSKCDEEARLKTVCDQLEKQKKDWGGIMQRLSEISLAWKTKLDDESSRIREKNRITSGMGGGIGNRSMEDIQNEQTERLKVTKAAQRDKDSLAEQEKELDRRHFSLKTNVTNKHTDLLQLEKDCSMLGEYESSIATYRAQGENLDSEIREIKGSAEEASREVAQVRLDVSAKKVDLDNCELQDKADLDAIRSARDALRSTNESLIDITSKLLALDVDDIPAALENVQGNILIKTDEKKHLERNIQSITSEISSQEGTKRTVRENLELREMHVKLMDMQKRQVELKKKHGLDDSENGEGGGHAAQRMQEIERDIQRADQQRSKYNEESFRYKGRLEVLEQQASDIDAKLRTPVYKNIEERHRKKCIEYETTELAAKDLDAYYQAMDQALQSFHTLKIKEINKIIRELWQLIYKGQDIDMIELESGPEEGAAASRSTRSYNYRVVMRKGNVPLDMRGRCSAGQRVLAAIVIRLALAETFCLDCGLLALDEPTTNLDEANRSGLAHALARIIISRQRQQNFQLICITHDEEFVRLMNTELAANTDFSLPEYYFKISREEDEEGQGSGKYFSKIERIPWADM